MAYENLLYDVRDDGVATISLNAPETRNALSGELLGELTVTLIEYLVWVDVPSSREYFTRAPGTRCSRPRRGPSTGRPRRGGTSAAP